VKILSVIGSLGHGGAETVLVDLVRGLARHEHCVLHFSAANGIVAHAPYVDLLRRRARACLDADWRCLGRAADVQAVLGGFRPDVVLFHWWGEDPWRPWIHECTTDPARERPTFVVVMHHVGGRPDACYDRHVIVSEIQRPWTAGRPDGTIHLIPNGVDPRRFSSARRASGGGTMVVGRVSSLRPGKIPADWIRTAAGYRLPRTRFVIAGEGALRATLAADVRALAADRFFALPGYVSRDDVPSLLLTFDVFCHVTSTAVECHPLGLLEALAAGLPIVAERRGGVPEIVRHGVNGLLADTRDEIGTHLHALRRDPALRARLALGARGSAERFALSRQLAAYEKRLADLERARRAARAARRRRRPRVAA
jgi:glycosyltransferase involved in cell wall biosynthesis